ncbi:Dihydrolipoyl dehydrogenase [Metallosphaera sp. J1]|uniref:dihydrolipoyl dehydrogenase n=1 Tax=Metallosphaera TaxID=41980 RepID=UPI001EDF5CA6|nr:dihydrolipoyl dehydrogenase [Metallosphaera javensis (ex Hofmann et al. 2022)]MCG3109484.1 Dihydrolipoyl dehydrogenase [Metallosphaera javensis (ex Hofmann et al. 2022)]BCS93474.1 MAG: dihydrolipoyl dehydrogenase [Metallosphaera javensis (ex Sakai et al. 2022)]
MTDFDAIILGGGGAGYTTAFELSRGGMKVLMLEPKGVLGGNCLYEGCIPSKTYWYGASEIERSRRVPFMKAEISFPKLVEWKDQVQERRFRQHDEEIKEHENLTFIADSGVMVDQQHVKVRDKTFSTRYLVIATGADPVVPKGYEGGITTHDLLMPKTTIREVPEKFAIVGGGYIGVEMASIFARLGSQVTLFASHLIKEVSQEVQALLEKELTNAGVKIVKERSSGILRENGKTVITEKGRYQGFDEVLVAVGRKPNTSAVNGIPLGKRGEIETSPGMRTVLDNVYAPGDVNGKFMLFHIAVLEGWVTAQNILEGNREVVEMDYNAVPFAVYSFPQVAWVGLWKEQAIARGFDVETRRYDLSLDSRAQIDGFAEGWMEVVIERGSQRILGAQVVGEDADMLIGELALAVGERLTSYELARISQPHPTQLEQITSLMRRVVRRAR